jgi:hypothetical protein
MLENVTRLFRILSEIGRLDHLAGIVEYHSRFVRDARIEEHKRRKRKAKRKQKRERNERRIEDAWTSTINSSLPELIKAVIAILSKPSEPGKGVGGEPVGYEPATAGFPDAVPPYFDVLMTRFNHVDARLERLERKMASPLTVDVISTRDLEAKLAQEEKARARKPSAEPPAEPAPAK